MRPAAAPLAAAPAARGQGLSPARQPTTLAISTWFAETLRRRRRLPRFRGRLAQVMRYGENPHQWAAFYATGDKRSGRRDRHAGPGQELSYNNLNDTDAAFELARSSIPDAPPSPSSSTPILAASPSARSGRGLPRALQCDPDQRLRRHRRAQRRDRRGRGRRRSSRSSPRSSSRQLRPTRRWPSSREEEPAPAD